MTAKMAFTAIVRLSLNFLFSPISSFPLIHPLNPAGPPLILLTVKPIGHSLWEPALNRSHHSPTGLCHHSKPKDLTRHISLTLLLASVIAEVFSPGCTSLSPETLKYPNAQATVRSITAEPQAWDSGIGFFSKLPRWFQCVAKVESIALENWFSNLSGLQLPRGLLITQVARLPPERFWFNRRGLRSKDHTFGNTTFVRAVCEAEVKYINQLLHHSGPSLNMCFMAT